MIVGCTDMGTGCDTILAQMVADVLDTDVDNIATFGVDTDVFLLTIQGLMPHLLHTLQVEQL